MLGRLRCENRWTGNTELEEVPGPQRKIFSNCQGRYTDAPRERTCGGPVLLTGASRTAEFFFQVALAPGV